MPYGTRANPSVNPLTQLTPKAPSSLVRTSRWTLLLAGILYGSWRLRYLTPIEQASYDKEKDYFEFVRARIDKFWDDKSTQDGIDLKNEAEGKPVIKVVIDGPLLLDDE